MHGKTMSVEEAATISAESESPPPIGFRLVKHIKGIHPTEDSKLEGLIGPFLEGDGKGWCIGFVIKSR